MTDKRRSMTPARKARILKAHDGKCYRCDEEFEPGDKVEFDHKFALCRGGTDDDSNIGPCHVLCHSLKTHGTKALRLGADVFENAKTKRIKKKHANPRTSKHSWPFRPFRNSRFKRKLDGTTVERRGA